MQSRGVGAKTTLSGRWPAWLLAGTATAMVAGWVTTARADDTAVQSQNLLGSPGIVDMPDARMAPDGQLSVGASYSKNTQHYNFGFQVTPWLETSFRYSGLSHFEADFPVYYDRSFAVRARLWDETAFIPAIALGIDDVVGTGIYGGEYLVASKKFGDVDATIGLGWGRLATADTIKNPLGILSNKFLNDRTVANPGATNFTALFHGRNAGIFGGATWQTPVNGLLLSAEYSSDSYQEEAAFGSFHARQQVNVGATYQVFDNISLGLDYIYGVSLAASVSFQLNPIGNPFPQRIGAQPTPLHIRTQEEQQQALNNFTGHMPRIVSLSRSQGRLVDALWRSAIAPDDMAVRGRTLVVRVSAGDPADICHMAAQIVAGSDQTLDTVLVTRGRQSARCTITHAPAFVNTVDEQGATTLHNLVIAPTALLMIDSTGPSNREAPPSLVSAAAAVRRDARMQQIGIESLSITNREAVVYYANYHYFYEKDALDRLVRILMADTPTDVERFRLIPTIGSVPQREFDILRSPTERSIEQTGTYSMTDNGNSGSSAPMHNPILAAATSTLYPRFSTSIFPQFRQQLFDPVNPFAVQFVGAGAAVLELLPGLSLQGEAEFSIYDNFNTARDSGSVLPHVRSDFLSYFTQGKNGIGDLEGEYRFRFAPNVFAIARVGYLESMFAGFGGEVLWRPEDGRWALGADLYDVKQRAFDRLFGLRDYHVVTGHVSLYYASPWYQIDLALHAGQYLAGDRGLTVEVTRRFDSGVEIGAFFTRTNVSAAQFGEGSFDKGIIIRIPINWAAPLNTQSQLNLDLRPVQRDGGQRLANDTLLFEETRRASQAEMENTKDVDLGR